MEIPQIIMIIIVVISIVRSFVNHGKIERKKISAGSTLVAGLIEVAILWWGGFWN